MKKLIITVFVLLAVGCMQAPQTELAGLKAAQDALRSAFADKDPAAIAAINANDGAWMAPNSETISGRAAIEVYVSEVFENGIGIILEDTEVYAHGDVGYRVGTFTNTDPGGEIINVGKYVEIWRLVDGDWQASHVIWNSNLPLATSEPEPEPEDEVESTDEA